MQVHTKNNLCQFFGENDIKGSRLTNAATTAILLLRKAGVTEDANGFDCR